MVIAFIYMHRLQKKLDVFRHSHFAHIAVKGTNVKIFQAIAGHADIQMIMNRYVHKQTGNIIDAGNRMQALLST